MDYHHNTNKFNAQARIPSFLSRFQKERNEEIFKGWVENARRVKTAAGIKKRPGKCRA